MQIIEQDGLRILIPDDGYTLKLKNEEMYSDEVYLGINASPSDWEEIKKEEVIDNG